MIQKQFPPWENFELAFDFRRQGTRQFLGRGDQRRRRGGPMLGLTEQIGGNHFDVRRVIRDNEDFRSAREKINPHLAEQLPLRFGDVGIAGPDDHVHRRDRLGASAIAATACTPPRM